MTLLWGLAPTPPASLAPQNEDICQAFQRHLEIKISEAGPSNQRVEPVLLSASLRELKDEGAVKVHRSDDINMDFIVPKDFGKRGDASRFRRIRKLYKEFDHYAGLNHYCGLYLEKLLYETLLEADDLYHVIGCGPTLGSDGKLMKPSGSEVLYFNGKEVYGKAGFDLFAVHKKTGIPFGIEAKNLRKWLYPDSREIWRMIARSCSVDCLPILAARKIAYVSYARLFYPCGILGFQTQFQYFNPEVLKDSDHFTEIIKKDGLGFADIKTTDQIPNHFRKFFQEILPKNIEDYYKRFMDNKELLKEYAIDEKLAENMNSHKRKSLYQEFEEQLDFE